MTGGGGTTSEYVRQELRAVVGARTGQTQPARVQNQMINQNVAVPSDLDSLGLSFEMQPTGKYTFLFGLKLIVAFLQILFSFMIKLFIYSRF